MVSHPARPARRAPVLAAAAVSLALASACRPESPRIHRDVARIAATPGGGADFTSPHVPPNRTTADGRVSINVQGGPSHLAFSLLVPEKLDVPLLESPAGRTILATTTPYLVPFAPEPHDYLGHHAICDPTQEFPTPGERPNPYACGPGLAHDCYDVTVLNNTSRDGGAQLWGTPATIEVERPKTRDAQIVDVRLGTPVRGTFIENTPEWTETMVTTDGRLLTGRVNSFPRAWVNPETGERRVDLYDVMYAVLPEGAAPCDVRGWQTFHPISHAPYDPALRGRYGIAAYPFRDTEGNLVPDGAEIGGTYPWVDREGANLFLSGVPDRLADTPPALVPRRCLVPGCESFGESTGWQKGYMVAGLWTHGKLVHLDALVNHVDWALGVDPAAHQIVTLYEAGAAGGPTEAVVGAGRVSGDDRVGPHGFGGNANILDSLQNLPNHHPTLRPGTPRDVVWLMSTGTATDEVAFDDFLNPDGFIVSTMQGSITRTFGAATPPQWYAKVRYWNGLEHSLLGGRAGGEIHVQNGATALPVRWLVPAYGEVAAGTGRIEPVAQGGIRGKGLWLDGRNRIRYPVAPQPRDVGAHDWYVGLFVDPRGSAGDEVEVLRFPDGSALRLRLPGEIVVARGDEVVATIASPAPLGAGWTHLGLDLREGNRQLLLYVDGFPVTFVRSEVPLFAAVPGDLFVGDDPTRGGDGLTGWIDDFKVFAQGVNPEVACNHAYGTLVLVGDDGGAGDDPALAAAADRYPALGHDVIAAALGDGARAGRRFACVHDYTRDQGALHAIPAGAVPLRERITFPEGPVRYGAPRPDSTGNAFCRSCHHEHGQGGLSLAALGRTPRVRAENDPRRQPLQPPRRVFGNVPAGWIAPGSGPGGPSEHVVAPPEGLVIDQWLLPHARAEAP